MKGKGMSQEVGIIIGLGKIIIQNSEDEIIWTNRLALCFATRSKHGGKAYLLMHLWGLSPNMTWHRPNQTWNFADWIWTVLVFIHHNIILYCHTIFLYLQIGFYCGFLDIIMRKITEGGIKSVTTAKISDKLVWLQSYRFYVLTGLRFELYLMTHWTKGLLDKYLHWHFV